MNFHLPNPLPAGGRSAVERVQFTGGYDRTPFPTEAKLSPAALQLTKSQQESCAVTIPWPVETFGSPVTSTATLRERPESYDLLVELARGKLNQLRNAIAELEAQGLSPAPEVMAAAKSATQAFVTAVLNPGTAQSAADAGQTIRHCYVSSDALMRQFTGTAIQLRTQGQRRIPTRWGCRIQSVPNAAETALFKAAFTSVVVVPNWAEIEIASTNFDWRNLDAMVDWAIANNYQPTIGPLIDFGEPLPGWLDGWEGELPSLAAFFCDFIESVVHRYQDRVKNWVLCSGFNHWNRYGVSEDDRLRLVGRMLELARTTDVDARWVIGLTQPWGDYLGGDDHSYSPLVFSDTLLRSGLSVNGFELELFAGNDDRASLLRDGLDTVRLLDLFGLLGVPLDVVARHPGRAKASDSQKAGDLSKCWRSSDGEPAQSEWGDWVSKLCLSYAHIRSFTWAAWTDTADDALGLVTADGRPKPLLRALQARREQCL
ncbi:endo-1,4-beta-xylanase [Limnoglobus roseus]|nr:endo-1,4-beta-xylanase [Limnoglobus roseus]